MYRFTGKLTPDADIKGMLKQFAQEGFAEAEALEVPPPPSPLDWLMKGAQQKLAVVKQALEAQASRAG